MQRLATTCTLLFMVSLGGCQILPADQHPRSLAPGAGDQSLRLPLPTVSLHAAAKYGDIVVTRQALLQGQNLNAVDEDGMSPLMLAAQGGHTDIVDHLLDCGAQTWTRNHRGQTALHLASLSGHAGVVEQLLASGARINARTHRGDTALLLATLHNHTAVVLALLDRHALVNLRDINGISPLMLASDNGNLAIVKMLVNRGANVNANTAADESALTLARTKGFREIVDLLKHAGAVEPPGYGPSTATACHEPDDSQQNETARHLSCT